MSTSSDQKQQPIIKEGDRWKHNHIQVKASPRITIIKGINYTEKITRKNGGLTEIVQHWQLAKPRPLKDCGVWVDGVKSCQPP